jgi:hypothetical protein
LEEVAACRGSTEMPISHPCHLQIQPTLLISLVDFTDDGTSNGRACTYFKISHQDCLPQWKIGQLLQQVARRNASGLWLHRREILIRCSLEVGAICIFRLCRRGSKTISENCKFPSILGIDARPPAPFLHPRFWRCLW